MIGLDTNVLIRYIAQDDEKQSKIATEAIEKDYDKTDFFYINHTVLCEVVWVLQRAYKTQKKQIINIIEQILHTSQFTVQSPDTVWKALLEYRQNSADFSDYLIAEINYSEGCKFTIPFDKKASKSQRFRQLT